MGITSFSFLCFFTILLFVYYLVPGKIQWLILPGASFAYYFLTGNNTLIIFPITAVTVTWGLLGILAKVPDEKTGIRRALFIAEIAVLLGILFVFKYSGMFNGGKGLAGSVLPLGLSFYTFILLGYFIDAYEGIAESEKNWLKVWGFSMYFPLMISGPIPSLRGDTCKNFFKVHKVSYENLTFGIQRMVWGLFKELVISERLRLLVDAVFDSYQTAPVHMIWLGAVAFTLQLYTNFSGCMDIVIGLSECFGITLPENFDAPFFSTTISEFWRRWHMTLGTWMKDHLFYPLLKSRPFIKLSTFLRGKCGKKKGRKYATYAAMVVLWSTVGIWHGAGFKYLFGVGLLQCFYIVFGELTLPFFTGLCGKLHINMKSKGYDFFRRIRTFLLMTAGLVFFRADSSGTAAAMLRKALVPFGNIGRADGAFDYSAIGLSIYDYAIIAASLVVLLMVSIIQNREHEAAGADGRDVDFHVVRKKIAGWKMPARWAFWMAAVYIVILLGQYGPGFSKVEFIYQGF